MTNDYIRLICQTCGREVDTPRCETDPPSAVMLTGIVCPDCDNGGFDMPTYFDAAGREISADPERFNDQ